MSGELSIVAVTVHRDGAIVERGGSIPVTDGCVRIGRLPLLLDERSVRARIDGASLRDLRFELDLEGLDRPDASQAERGLLEAERRVRAIEREQSALREERETALRLAPTGPWKDAPDLAPERLLAWSALDEPVAAWTAAIDDRLRALDREHREAVERRQIAAWELDRQGSADWWRRWAPSRVVVLGVATANGSPPDQVRVTLSYRIEGACWTPRYALYADSALRRGRFVSTALVAQTTGEDWRGVRLVLSTAPCQRTIDVPELKALRLGRAQPPAPSPWRELPEGLEALFPADVAPLPQAAPIAIETRTAELTLDDLGPGADEMAEDEPEQAFRGPPGVVSARTMPPQAIPAPQAMPEVYAKSRGGLMSRALSAVGSVGDAFGSSGGAAPPASRAAPPPASRAAPAAPPQQAAPPELDVEPKLLDYPNLRLAGFEAAIGVRGRLWEATPAELVQEAGLPAEAAAWLIQQQSVGRSRAGGLRNRALPPHHVLPGPIEDADWQLDAGDAVDVPADGRFHHVSVASDEVELDVRYRAVPRQDARAYRTVKATLARATPLLAGPVDVHVDGALVLTVPWKGAPRGGTLTIGLGVEEGLRVARNVRHREELGGIVTSYRRIHSEIEVEIASGLARTAQIEVLERVPVAKDDEITVELADAQPTAEPFTGDEGDPILEGGRRQLLTVPAGGTAKATLHYVVTLGAKLEIVGGDRRG